MFLWRMAEVEKRVYEYEKSQATTSLDQEEKKQLFRVYHVINYILWVVEILLVFRFFFRLLGANPSSGFVQFLYGTTGVLLAPFFGIFGTPRVGVAAFETTTLVAMAVYAVLVYAIIKFVRVVTATKEEQVEV